MKILDATHLRTRDHEQRDPADIDCIVVHRVGVDHQTGVSLGGDAESICAHFTGVDGTYPEVAEATGGKIPYTLMVGAEGQVWQTLRLADVGPHALSWSRHSVGVACIGDFRTEPPTLQQRESCVELVSLLAQALGIDGHLIRGHSELAGGSSDPGKQCPGHRLSMAHIRWSVAAAIADRARAVLATNGVVLS